MNQKEGKIIESNMMLKYFERLIRPVRGKRFIDDYLQGNGNELGVKFWSENSSSRLAFDLYSWIAEEKGIVDFQFEKKLPGVICSKKGPAGVPNMDVFIETKDDRIFVESKYLEPASFSYMIGKEPNLSKAYWSKEDHGGKNLSDRFYGRGDIAERFSRFCEKIQEKIKDSDKRGCRWFDAKQETCHLFGIIFYLLGGEYKKDGQYFVNSKRLDKNVHLYNVIRECQEDKFELDKDSLPKFFEENAEELMKDIFPRLQFEFRVMTVQKLIKDTNFFGLDFTKAKAFGLECSLADQMEQYCKQDKKRGEY